MLAVADSDGFNWGYDPVHYGVPEGSYATDPDGVARWVRGHVRVCLLGNVSVMLSSMASRIFYNNVMFRVVKGRPVSTAEVVSSCCLSGNAPPSPFRGPTYPSSIRELREMVQALHAQGWRVVQDVVYNHTFASGPFSRWAGAMGGLGPQNMLHGERQGGVRWAVTTGEGRQGIRSAAGGTSKRDDKGVQVGGGRRAA